MSLSRDQILQPRQLLKKSVKVPEWAVGGETEVFVREMSGAERDAYEAALYRDKEESLTNARAKLAVRCVCDENGSLIFNESDIAALGEQSARALERVGRAAQRLNGLSDQVLEEAVGNSKPSPGDAPLSASP
jgi:hypothetical protein